MPSVGPYKSFALCSVITSDGFTTEYEQHIKNSYSSSRQTDRHTNYRRDKETDMEVQRQTDTKTQAHRHREREIETDRQTHTYYRREKETNN